VQGRAELRSFMPSLMASFTTRKLIHVWADFCRQYQIHDWKRSSLSTVPGVQGA